MLFHDGAIGRGTHDCRGAFKSLIQCVASEFVQILNNSSVGFSIWSHSNQESRIFVLQWASVSLSEVSSAAVSMQRSSDKLSRRKWLAAKDTGKSVTHDNAVRASRQPWAGWCWYVAQQDAHCWSAGRLH